MTRQRYYLIDALRGFALLNMLAFHFLYDVYVIYGLDFRWPGYPGIVAWERFICVSFIVLSGISLHFSRHAYRRGLIINACGLLITLVTWIFVPEQMILFGVLNCIGCAMLLTQLMRRLLDKINPFAGLAAGFLLFGFFYGLPNGFVGFFGVPLAQVPDFFYTFPPLAVVGLPSPGFFSTDYFPLLPWLFLYIAGFFLWRVILSLRWERFFTQRVPVLEVIGRYTLWIYMIHQPVLMGIAYLFFGMR